MSFNQKSECSCNNTNVIENEKVTESENRECSNRDRRMEMMMRIKELNFAVVDLSQYLDTHPEDRKALCLHNYYARELNEVKDKYQKIYGPLSQDYPCNKWRWIEDPWPWERGNY